MDDDRDYTDEEIAEINRAFTDAEIADREAADQEKTSKELEVSLDTGNEGGDD